MFFSRIFAAISGQGQKARSAAKASSRLRISYRIFSPVWLMPTEYVSGKARQKEACTDSGRFTTEFTSPPAYCAGVRTYGSTDSTSSRRSLKVLPLGSNDFPMAQGF